MHHLLLDEILTQKLFSISDSSLAGLPPLPLFAENFRFSPFFPLFFRCSAFFRFFVFYAFLYKQLYFPIENSA
jgi:hypothetical protein